jgi:hypothetical protein
LIRIVLLQAVLEFFLLGFDLFFVLLSQLSFLLNCCIVFLIILL